VIVVTQYLLALYMADDFHYSAEQTQQVWDGVVALNDAMADAGAFVFQDGLHGGSESATVVRQSGDDFVMTDGDHANPGPAYRRRAARAWTRPPPRRMLIR
jgi:hypothetical protein